MNLMKRLLLVPVVFTMLLSLALPLYTALAAAATVEINYGQPISLARDATKSSIPLMIRNIPDLGPGNGIGAFTFDLNWNTSYLRVDSLTQGPMNGWTVMTGTPNNNSGGVTITGFTGDKPLTADTLVANLTVTAVGPAGTTANITLTIRTFGDMSGKAVSVTAMNGVFQIGGGGQTYALTMAVNGSGTTNPQAGTPRTCAPGETVTLTATPASGWQFVNWTGEVASPTSPTTTTVMNSDKTITANFAQGQGTTYTLNVGVTGQGTTSPSGSQSYLSGTTVNLTANPAQGWQFQSWSGDVANLTSPRTTVIINGNKTVTANFTQVQSNYSVTIATTGNGSTDPAGTQTFTGGMTVTIKATPAQGWQFASWSGDVANPTSATTTFVANGNKTITANFIQPGQPAPTAKPPAPTPGLTPAPPQPTPVINPAPTPIGNQPSSGSGGMSGGTIALIAVGGVLGIALLVFIIKKFVMILFYRV